MALAPLTVEPADAHGFVTAFLTRWGETGGHNGRREKRTRWCTLLKVDGHLLSLHENGELRLIR